MDPMTELNLPAVGVHVLSEHVFCPRAALLALESSEDDGEEERPLGPRLDGCLDYDEHHFVEELQAAWGQARLWLTLMAPATLLMRAVWRLYSPTGGLMVLFPLLFLVVRLGQVLKRVVTLVRTRALLRAAEPATIDLQSEQIRLINWWSLRKAGFDCSKPVQPHHDAALRLTGRPWRVLTKDGTLKIPVIRKHRGAAVHRPQHLVRSAAYCQLLQTCEQVNSPFGVLMFAGSYDCVLLPNSAETRRRFESALDELGKFLKECEGGKWSPAAPTDNRCSGCHWGKPQAYVAGQTDTILKSQAIAPYRTRAGRKGLFHCPCGDRFTWVPPHDDAVNLGMTQKRPAPV